MNEKIKKVVIEAYNTVPMYYKIRGTKNINIESILQEGKWSDLPIIDKNTVVSEGSSSLSSASIPLLLTNELISGRTSGSTGKYMEIFWNRSDYNKSMLPLWYYRNKYYSIKPDDKMCFFFTIHKVGEEEEQCIREKNTLGFSKSNLDMDKLAKIYIEIKEYSPKWLLLQPSMGALLCECMDRFSLEPIESVKYIEFSGEILTDEIRKNIKSHFQCQIANQYGSNEFNSIAYECPYGNMHIMNENVHVEVLDDNNKEVFEEKGEVCITSLTNKAMPLIRYRLGDIAKKISNVSCSCGNKNHMIELLSGRTNDLILCSNGSKINVYSLVRGIDNINYITDGIVKQFQIVQNDIDNFTIKLVVDDEDELFYEDNIKENFISSLIDENIKYADFNFEFYTDLFPDDVTGKYKYFINNIG